MKLDFSKKKSQNVSKKFASLDFVKKVYEIIEK